FFHHVIRFHPAEGARAADDCAVVRIQRPQALMHRLLTKTDVIKNVAHGRNIKILRNPFESLCIIDIALHDRLSAGSSSPAYAIASTSYLTRSPRQPTSVVRAGDGFVKNS